MRYLFPAFALLAFLTLPGCTPNGCPDDEAPAPACYSGKVVGAACMDGVLIEVDPQYAIGKAYNQYTNLVAAVNMQPSSSPDLTIDGQVVQVGQTVYFTYTVSPKAREAVCPQNTVPLPVPHLVLSNLGATACAPTKAQ
ncbi:hypothetical protein E5K00_12370 [Hymenobacter aquaticus]|uniref:Uncharacterized protein n=1 Tax=Hymenobacter aquaticus TaxID=1867101 RepID=A0A4Z0Q795_9BACT|nr:hypothetical protein [Hymenobacter aquaticus]TGE25947.1 hypothetical protein E5K00_12370 [Hymenobacter aquaticus]